MFPSITCPSIQLITYIELSNTIIEHIQTLHNIHTIFLLCITRSSDTVQFISLPMPIQVSHVISSKIRNGVTPRPPHRQHNRPPMRGSPGMTTVAPGGGIEPNGIGATREVELCITGGDN